THSVVDSKVNFKAVHPFIFSSPGDGPFPGIIDIHGRGGGLWEYRVSLLACRSFGTLPLAYYRYEDLPKVLTEIHLEYFEEAVNYMLQHPQVGTLSPGVGLLGISKGDELCLHITSFSKNITATVSINGSMISSPPDESGFLDILNMYNDPFHEPGCQSLIPLEKAEGHFLFIVGKDDHIFQSEYLANKVSHNLQGNGKEKPEITSYPGAGHIIEPPFFPLCPVAACEFVNNLVVVGGEPRAHSQAQVDAWQQIQTFFNKNLNGKLSITHSKL
uniref:BAAT/Acyl-CoA thioester hydrolase C-terminal domain-containing protein n=1 Tax=Terrapene triunguis TaxID=2587831 RepID=A0A674J2K4_9SAUR